jgi:hypothetical protein
MVLRQAAARYEDLPGYVAINEPHGTMGAPLVSAALPESRLILLVRDPRDVAASAFDAHRKGSWAGKRPINADRFFTTRSKTYLRDLMQGCEAFRQHQGPRVIVRYEDLRANTLPELQRLCHQLGLEADDRTLDKVVEAHSWESIPDEEKGPGRFYRKASPGSWREDLTPEQIATVEDICAPVLEGFYDGEITLLSPVIEVQPI